MAVRWLSVAVFLVAACQLTAGEWTFSLRISSARCGNAAAAGPCDGYILAVCLRPLGTVRIDGQSCWLFIAGTTNELMERNLTSLDEVNSTLMRDESARPYVKRSFPYIGGVQLYIVVLTKPDLPPFNIEEDIVDEVFVDLERTPGGGECSTVDVVGLRGRLNATISLTVDCYTGYSGDDCSCSADDATCESTGVALNNCGTTPTSMNLSPSTSSPPPAKPPTSSNPASKPTSTPTPTGSAPTAVGALNSTEASGESSIMVPVAASGGGLVVVLVVLIAVVTIVLVYRRRRHRKMYRLDLSALTVDSSKFPPTIPPNDVVDDDGVTYTTVVNTGYHNEGYEEKKVDLSQLPKSEIGGLVYADLDYNSESAHQHTETETGLKYVTVDHERPTYSTFRAPRSKPSEPETVIQYSVVRKPQPHKYVNVPRPKPRKNLPQTEQNLYSIVPPGSHRAPTNQ